MFDFIKTQDFKEKMLDIKGFFQSLSPRINEKYNEYHNKLLKSGKGTAGGVNTIAGSGTDIVNLDNGVIRVTDTTNQRGTLVNEFVETKNPSIYPAEWYKQHPDTVIGDTNIPTSNLHIFAGIENGALKVDSLLNFADSTTVIPMRNIRLGTLPMKELYYDHDKYLLYKDSIENLPYLQWVKHQLKPRYSGPTIQAILTNGDTIPVGLYLASILDKKMVFGNPKGGLFVANFNNLSKEQLDSVVNPYLKENPSYLTLWDMGQNSLYGLKGATDPTLLEHTNMDVNLDPTYDLYWHLFTESASRRAYDPKLHYLIGVKKKGGPLNYLTYF